MKSQRFLILAALVGLAACGPQTPTETPHLAQEDTPPAAFSSPTNTPAAPQPTITQIPTETLAPTTTLTPTLLPSSFTDEFGHEMVLVPAGSFEMGSESGDSDEVPVHSVYLDAFYMDKYEVTNQQFAFFLAYMGNQFEEGEYWMDTQHADIRIHQNGEAWFVETGFENFPVIYVNWYAAQAYCQFRGGRLPTESEWEKTARGEEGFIYPWGDYWFENLANASEGDRYSQLAPVGRFPDGASPFGVLDMAGNVEEWVADWYNSDYYQISPAENPMGPDSGRSRVLRGSSWRYYTDGLRTTNRSEHVPGYSSYSIGFRCASSIP